MNPNHPFSTRLKAARLAKAAKLKAMGESGYSQERLGVETGIEEATASARMNQYERGKHLPDLQQAIRFAEALDVPLAYLFCIEDELADLLMQLYQLPQAQRQSLLGRIRGLLSED